MELNIRKRDLRKQDLIKRDLIKQGVKNDLKMSLKRYMIDPYENNDYEVGVDFFKYIFIKPVELVLFDKENDKNGCFLAVYRHIDMYIYIKGVVGWGEKFDLCQDEDSFEELLEYVYENMIVKKKIH